MTIEEKMEHFRRLSLESANSKSEESLDSYRQSMDEDLENHKESAMQLAEETKRARINQARSSAKKELAASQMQIRKDLTKTQSGIKSQVFEKVRQKIMEYRKTPEYIEMLKQQILDVTNRYKGFDITIYIDSEDSALLDELKQSTEASLELYDHEFLGGIRAIIPAKNILIDNSLKTRMADEQEQFTIE